MYSESKLWSLSESCIAFYHKIYKILLTLQSANLYLQAWKYTWKYVNENICANIYSRLATALNPSQLSSTGIWWQLWLGYRADFTSVSLSTLVLISGWNLLILPLNVYLSTPYLPYLSVCIFVYTHCTAVQKPQNPSPATRCSKTKSKTLRKMCDLKTCSRPLLAPLTSTPRDPIDSGCTDVLLHLLHKYLMS